MIFWVLLTMKKCVKFILLLCVLPLTTLLGCADDTDVGDKRDINAIEHNVSSTTGRVIAKDYQVLSASEAARQCRTQPQNDASAVLLLQVGQQVSLLSITEKGRRVDGHLWLHVYANQAQQKSCFVLADILVPIASRPIVQ